MDLPACAPPDPASPGAPRWQARFQNPLQVLTAWQHDEVRALLRQVQAHAQAGRWCVGELAYEAAGAFDPALVTQRPRPAWPLARFAVFERMDAGPWPQQQSQPPPPACAVASPAAPRPAIGEWQLGRSYADYADSVERARQAMLEGECYQVNLTEALQADWPLAEVRDIAAWFERLRAAQPGGYQAWLDWGDQQVLSLSPELFFDWRPDGTEGRLTCQPMKGTAPRHADALLDAQACVDLRGSAKEQAENVMIVDLLRNDMGRIALPGSVQVSGLFEVQALPTVWQMTSTVTARTRPGVGLPELFAALYPCGSVTGAPKARAMHWIRELESEPRGVYCGAVGLVRPGGAATFNVPIRTVALERDRVAIKRLAAPRWRARYGVGSAITFYAEPAAEWRELAAKTRFLQRAGSDFDLLETLRLEDGAYWLLDRHLARMASSAAYFGFDWQPHAVLAALQAVVPGRARGVYRVRLTCSAAGQSAARVADLMPTPEPVLFNLSDCPLESSGLAQEFVVHKTTRRQHYDTRLVAASGVFDTLLVNERGELTEFTRGNVALQLGGRWLTPALHCGLLAGTYRAELLARGEIAEAVLTLTDLHQAQAIAFFNSLRGWLGAQWQPGPLNQGVRMVGCTESSSCG
ncbi:MAG: chorismate-binding protein [Rhodoferax sp.]|nr:chorismate-binding protein [Rhodoferax sp.]